MEQEVKSYARLPGPGLERGASSAGFPVPFCGGVRWQGSAGRAAGQGLWAACGLWDGFCRTRKVRVGFFLKVFKSFFKSIYLHNLFYIIYLHNHTQHGTHTQNPQVKSRMCL